MSTDDAFLKYAQSLEEAEKKRNERPAFTPTQREYETIDDDIAKLEQCISDTEKEIAENSSDYVRLQELSDEKDRLETELAEKMDRWVYLNDLAERIEKGEMV